MWYWHRDPTKLRDGKWIRARISLSGKPMLTIETQEDGGRTIRVNQSKLRKNPDKWQDFTLPEEPDPVAPEATRRTGVRVD